MAAKTNLPASEIASRGTSASGSEETSDRFGQVPVLRTELSLGLRQFAFGCMREPAFDQRSL